MTSVEQSDIITDAEDYVRQIFEQKIPSNVYTYHNWVHTCQVRDEVMVLARQAGLQNGELEMLNLATLFHDTGFSETYAGHEEVSIRLAREFLESRNYPPDRIDTIAHMIEVTRIDVKPRTTLPELALVITGAEGSGAVKVSESVMVPVPPAIEAESVIEYTPAVTEEEIVP